MSDSLWKPSGGNKLLLAFIPFTWDPSQKTPEHLIDLSQEKKQKYFFPSFSNIFWLFEMQHLRQLTLNVFLPSSD